MCVCVCVCACLRERTVTQVRKKTVQLKNTVTAKHMLQYEHCSVIPSRHHHNYG